MAGQARVQEPAERHRHGVDAVDADAAARQGADRPAVAEVDADVPAAAPHDEVAAVAVVAAHAVVPAVAAIDRDADRSPCRTTCRLWLWRSENSTRPEQSKRRGPAAPYT